MDVLVMGSSMHEFRRHFKRKAQEPRWISQRISRMITPISSSSVSICTRRHIESEGESGLDNYHTPWESWNVVVVKYMVNYINELDNGVRPLFLSSADDALEEPDWLQREV